MYQQRFSFLAWVVLFGIPSMLLDNLEKYIIQFGEIQFVLWTNIFSKWNKFIVAFVSIGFFTLCGCCLLEYFWTIWRNVTLYNLEKYILQFGQIHSG